MDKGRTEQKVTRFKAGDVVVCTTEPMHYSITKHKEYTVTASQGSWIEIINDKGCIEMYFHELFGPNTIEHKIHRCQLE